MTEEREKPLVFNVRMVRSLCKGRPTSQYQVIAAVGLGRKRADMIAAKLNAMQIDWREQPAQAVPPREIYVGPPDRLETAMEIMGWRKCPQCKRENSVETWNKNCGKCPNCQDLHDREAGDGEGMSAEQALDKLSELEFVSYTQAGEAATLLNLIRQETQELREERDAWYQADCEAREKLVRAESALGEMRSKTLDEAIALAQKLADEMERKLVIEGAQYLRGYAIRLLALKSGEPAPKEGK